jgi:predicted oxidoreductase
VTVSRVKLANDLEFSRIVYGMWRLSDDADTSPAHVRTKIEACLEQGITTMDQADIYGGYAAEEVLGRALAGTDLRESIEIVTKCDIVAPVGRHADAKVKHYDTSAAHIEASVDHSLRLMGIERIDLLLIHRPDPLMDHHETGAALDGLIAAGKVGHVGVSNFRPWDWSLLQSAMNATLATNQIELSLLAHAGFSNGDVAFLQERGVPPMAWSPLAGGSLFAESSARMRTALDEVGQAHGVDASAVAIAWLLRHPANILPVMGTNNLDRIRTLADAEKVDLDRQTWFHLYELALGHEVP